MKNLKLINKLNRIYVDQLRLELKLGYLVTDTMYSNKNIGRNAKWN